MTAAATFVRDGLPPLAAGVCPSCGVFPTYGRALCDACSAVVPGLRPPVHGARYERERGNRLPLSRFVLSRCGTHRYCGVCWMFYDVYGPCRHLEHLEARH